MSRFRVLTENYFNVHQFSGHTITASTGTTSGHEPFRVATGRRKSRNSWIAGTTGDAWLRVTCDQVRAPDMIALDGHNLAGETVALQYTSSTAGGWASKFSVTIPTVTLPNASLDSPGAYCEDGLWLHKFASSGDLPAATDFRIYVSALGGNEKAQIGLAWLGKSFSPAGNTLRPFDDEPVVYERGARVESFRAGTFTARLTDREGDQARYHIADLMWRGETAIVVPHPNNAERSVVAKVPSGSRSMPYPDDWPLRVLAVDWVEHDPKIR